MEFEQGSLLGIARLMDLSFKEERTFFGRDVNQH